MRLHGYWRSSASYRVRIVLGLKGIDYDYLPVHLVLDGGEQHDAAFRELNPQGLVPMLEDGELRIGQSLAIAEYLDETHPEPALLPPDPAGRARVRQMAQLIACDMHPLNNLRVLKYLRYEMGQGQAQIDDWYRHWLVAGFGALEELVRHHGSERYCHGDAVSLADACLVPQVYNARRVDLSLDAWPALAAVTAHLEALPAFAAAAPERQPDAE